jgi:chemotaxis protein MotA
MLVIVGLAIVIVGVLGGYIMHGGTIGVLLQWSEFMIIGGATIGSLIAGAPPRSLKQLIGRISMVFKGDSHTKQEYLNLLTTLFEIFNVARREGMMALEYHIENPLNSPILSKNTYLVKHENELLYLCDTIKLLLGGTVPPHDLESLLEADIDTHHAESAISPSLVQKLGDALPGLGIVAAVLGIVITMQAIDGPAEEIGRHVAAALVGTFLGVLLCYGFMQPIATHLELLGQAETRYLECMKAGIVSFAKGNPPSIVVEFARRVIFNEVRPSFAELEQAIASIKIAR